MAKLSDTQTRLDKKKYLKSETVGIDLSGNMDYCGFCSKRTDTTQYDTLPYACAVSHEVRIDECLCGKAYGKMKRQEKK